MSISIEKVESATAEQASQDDASLDGALQKEDAAIRVGFQQWYTVAILTFFILVSFIDRSALNLLAPAVKSALHLTDIQLSLLMGTSFAIFYSVVGLPSGYLVDRFKRRSLLWGAIVLWSIMTAICGFTSIFGVLFIGRMGVGLGEALISPIAFSVIRDAFPNRLRARATSIYFMGSSCGAGASLIVVGWLMGLLPSGSTANIPVLGSFQPWQLVLVIIGLTGVPLSFLVWTFREPTRRLHSIVGVSSSWMSAIRYLGKSRWTLVPVALAFGCSGIAVAGSAAWIPTYIIHTFRLPAHQVGETLGTITVIGAFLGLLTSGIGLDKVGVRYGGCWVPAVGAVAMAISFCIWMVIPFVTDLRVLFFLLGSSAFMMPWAGVAASVTLSRASPSEMVGKFAALFFLAYNLMGYMIGPTLIAALEKYVFSGPTALIHGISAGTGGAQIVYCFLLLIISFRGLKPTNRPKHF